MIGQFSRFLAAGAVNTVAGYTIIFTAQYLTKNPYLANTIGFLLGSGISYHNHSRYTFRKQISLDKGVLYGIITFVCFLFNLFLLKLLLPNTNQWLAQLLSVSAYVVVNYCLLSRFVFRHRP